MVINIIFLNRLAVLAWIYLASLNVSLNFGIIDIIIDCFANRIIMKEFHQSEIRRGDATYVCTN